MTARLQEVHTAIPGRVESYDAATQTADVLPLVQTFALQEDGTRLPVTLPVLPAIPVVQPGANGFRVTYPVAAGDTVLVVFTEASLDAWQARGGLVDPADPRRHHLADAVAIVGLHANPSPWSGAAADATTWGHDGGPQVVVRAGAVELGSVAASPPTEQLVLGTTYRTQEDAMLTQVEAAVVVASTACTTALGLMTTGAAVNAVPIIGGLMAAGPFIGVATQFGVVSAQLVLIQGYLEAFKAQASTYLSNTVKTK
jgi:hypothetical protein